MGIYRVYYSGGFVFSVTGLRGVNMNKEEIKELTYDLKVDLIRNKNLFCPMTWAIGVLGRIEKIVIAKETVVFVLFTIAFFRETQTVSHWWIYAIVAVVFIFTEALKILISQRTTVNLDGKFGVQIQKNIQDTIQKIMEGENVKTRNTD
jgi:hypothetical protein